MKNLMANTSAVVFYETHAVVCNAGSVVNYLNVSFSRIATFGEES